MKKTPKSPFFSGLPFVGAIIFLAFSLSVKSQPGWVDYTSHYYYSILDSKGKPVEFKKNKSYQIIIDSLSFSGKSIPQDSLIPVIENVANTFENYIRINDFAFRWPQSQVPVEIRIVYQGDTMALNQTAGNGGRYTRDGDIQSRTLQFIPGYYYFPDWTGEIYDNPIETNGSVEITNLHQRNFIISKSAYESRTDNEYEARWKRKNEMHALIVDNFLSHGMTRKVVAEPTQISPSCSPYKRPHWDSPFYPSVDANTFVGLVEYTCDTTNLYISKQVFSTFNKADNTISHFMPATSLNAFYCSKLHFDALNETMYQSLAIRENYNDSCNIGWDTDCPYTPLTLKSQDGGKTWKESASFQKILDRYHLRNLEFIDDRHAIGFTRRKAIHPRGYGYQRGTYYLIKNMRVVDSLQTAENAHYNDNYNKYDFSRKGDTIFLGAWGIDPQYSNKPHTQPMLIRTDDSWNFEVIEETITSLRRRNQKNLDTRHFEHFRLKDNREFIFNNRAGSLFSKRDVARKDETYDVRILEKGNQIYILEHSFTLVSFDAGSHWQIYPQPLNDRANYHFLEINEKDEIVFFDMKKMEKVTYQFRMESE